MRPPEFPHNPMYPPQKNLKMKISHLRLTFFSILFSGTPGQARGRQALQVRRVPEAVQPQD